MRSFMWSPSRAELAFERLLEEAGEPTHAAPVLRTEDRDPEGGEDDDDEELDEVEAGDEED
jgi:hypothetical protein